MKEIYQQTVEEVFERVKGNISGLTSEQVKSSREKCGWNELAEGKKKNILQIFLEQYKDFLVSDPEAKVLRDGSAVQIPARELVIGDVILLEAGDMISADGRLIENASLKVDESALTGESLAVEKSIEIIPTEVPLGDRKNMLFSGKFCDIWSWQSSCD